MRLHDYLDHWARRRPESELGVHEGRTITYSEAASRINRIANALLEAGIGPGDRIAILGKNSIDYLLLFSPRRRAE